uniref:Pali-domain-containing protein n=1 Tax=Moniliophthora roreri TaxID=221103 RepID=A0A0W0G605_MONRR
MISRALGLFIFCSFAAALSFILVSASSPGWESISFLNVGSEGSERHFGVFGYTGSKAKMGYKFPDLIPEPKTLNGFTRTLVAHPIAITLLISITCFGADIAIFSNARNRYRDQGLKANLGNANWITLVALFANLIAMGAIIYIVRVVKAKNGQENGSAEAAVDGPSRTDVEKPLLQRWFPPRGAKPIRVEYRV